MINPITNKEEINWYNFVTFLRLNLRLFIKTSLVASLLAIGFYFYKSDSYNVKISFYTNYNEQQGPNLFSNIISQNNNSSNLDFSISDFLQSDNFLNEVVESNYEIFGTTMTLIEYWGEDYDRVIYLNPIKTLKKINYLFHVNSFLKEDQKKSNFVKSSLSQSINHAESRFSGLNTISISNSENMDLSIQIINNIYDQILNYSTSVVNTKAREKKEFIANQLSDIKVKLELAEDKKTKFLIENKNINDSPNLLLQKTRIDRDVSLYNQLYFTLSDQLELAKIDEQDSTSPIFVLDGTSISYSKLGNSLIELVIIFIFITIFISISFLLFKERKKLFL